MLVAHSTGELVDNAYTVLYDNKKRADEVYTTLCFNLDFEISYFGELKNSMFYILISSIKIHNPSLLLVLENIYIYTRKVHPSQEVLDQIYEILAKYDVEPHLVRLVDHVNCGRCN